MYRIMSLTLLLLSVSTLGKDEAKCFRDNKKVILFKKEKGDKVSLTVKKEKKYSGLYFCHKKNKELQCEGDDDTGVFILSDEFIYLIKR